MVVLKDLQLIGSVLTKTYRNDADLDVDILIKPNKMKKI